MPKVDVPPTKSNLRKIKNDLTFAYEGFDLLDQKREILVMEIVKTVNKIKGIEERFQYLLNELYNSYRNTAMEMGSDRLERKSLSEKEAYNISIGYSRLMGIDIPEIKLRELEIKNTSNLYGTTTGYDISKKISTELLILLAQYATVTKSIFMLSRELKKVQRRVNALEKIFIPQQEESKKYITDRLEEMEREELFVMKMINEKTK